MIKKACDNLYDGYENIPERSRQFIESACATPDLESLYAQIKNDEGDNKEILLEFQEGYPNVLNEDNLEEILRIAKEKKKSK